MKHLVLTLFLVLGLATSVSANDKSFEVGDEFFCTMDTYTVWDPSIKQLVNRTPEKFKLSIVDQGKIKFGNESILRGC